MTTFDDINAAAGSNDTARRVAMLHDAGHTWMDPQAQLALANSNMSDQHVMSAADTMSQMMNDSTQAVSSIFEDPVLHKAPSTTMQVSQWVGSNVGYLPVEQSDLSQVQAQLQAKGFGVGLPTDGTWDSAWNSQFQQAAYQDMLEKSDQVGQLVPPHKVAHSVLEGLFPSHSVPKLWGWIKSIPGDVRSVAADAVGGVAAAGQQAVGGIAAGQGAPTAGGARVQPVTATPGQVYGSVAAGVEHALGNKQITAENIQAHPVARLVNDLSTLMMFVPAGRLGSPLAKALGEDILRGTAKEAFTRSLDASVAKRGPGVIANSLVRNPQGFGFDALGKVFNNGVAKNIPVLKYVYPNIIEPTAREDGWYYATRRIAAQPMRVPVVNLAARASQYTTMLGASAQGTAALANRITGTSDGNETQLAKSVYDQHTITGITGMAMDLVMQLGNPTLGLKPSEAVGEAVRSAEALTNRALGGVNDVTLQFDRAMRGSTFRKGDFQYDRLVSAFGKSKTDWYLNQMLDRFAASRAARTMMYTEGVPADGDVAGRLAALTHQVWQSPEDLQAAKQDLLLDPEGMMHAFWEQRSDIVADAHGRNATGMGNYFEASDDAHTLFKNWGDTLVHPGVYKKLAEDRQAVKDANEADAALGPWKGAYDRHKSFLDAADKQDGNPAVRVHDTIEPTDADHAAFADQGPAEAAAPGIPPVFHGSRSPLPDALGDRFMGAAADNLFGPGLYTTNSEKIAQQYARGGSHYSVHVAGGKKPKVLDLDSAAPSWFKASVKAAAEGAGVEVSGPTGSAADLIRHLREELSAEGLTTSHADEIIHGVTDSVEANGYDAMTHVGGIYASKSGEQHQVYIWLHPEDMKAKPRLAKPATRTVTRKMTEGERHQAASDFADRTVGKPQPTDPQHIVATQSYVRNNFGTPDAGRLGLARLDSETSADARQKFLTLARRLKAAGDGEAIDAELKKSDLIDMADELGVPHPDFTGNPAAASAEADAVRQEAWTYLVNELGKNPHELAVRGPAQMVGTILQEARRLSAPVSAPVDAPAEVRALFDSLKAKGYKPVWGTDIGHHLADPIVDPAVIESHRRWTRKLASGLGINTEHFSTDAPGMVAKRDTLRRWQEDINAGKIKPSAGMTAARMYEWALTQSETKPLSTAGRTAFAAFRRLHKQSALARVNEGKADNLEEAYHQIQNDLGVSNGSIATMGRKQFVKAMTALPPEVMEANRLQGLADDTPIITEAEAELMHRHALQAMAARPMSMMGLSKFEDVARASFTPLGVVANTKVPLLSDVAARAATLPNDLIRARDALKFKFSPLFSARRVTKTVVKEIAAGINAPTFTPLKSLNDAGGPELVAKAIAHLDAVYPEDQIKAAGWDAMDRFLNANDIFAFSPRHHMAYAAWDLKQQGKSIPEIRKTLDKIFTYGNRTALERSMGTLWYPFSFEKSLYKLLGGHLLDHPGQRAALAMGLDAYHAADKHAHIQDWLDKHLPVAKELEKLNAFTDGVNLGQFGGINAPLLNMFLPQHSNAPVSSQLMQRLVPAYNDLNALLLGYDAKTGKANLGGEIGDTGKVSWWYLQNQAEDIKNRLTGARPSILAQHRPAETAAGQNEDGWQLRNALITSMSPLINYNYHNPKAPYVFGTGPDVPPELRGQKVDRSHIGTLVQRFFPLFDPNAAQPLAQAKQQAAAKQIAVITAANPERGAAYRTFQEAADKVNGYATRGEYQPAQLAQLTQNFRNVAVHLSESDSGFLKFYNTYYLRLFGPIENVTG